MARTLEERLAAEDNDYGPAWKPKEGEQLIATVIRYSTGQSAYGPVRTVILERESGERVSIWLSSEILRVRFEELKPKPGERIGIRYDGKHPSKGYRRYSMVVDRPEDAEPDFSPMGGEHSDYDANNPFADGSDGEPFGTNPYPATYAAGTMKPNATRNSGHPLAITPPARRGDRR